LQSFLISQPAILQAAFTASADTVDLSVNNNASFTDASSGAASYLWDFGDASYTDTVQSPSHFYTASGTYSVMLITSNGTCFDTAYAKVVAIDSLNLNAVPSLLSPTSLLVAYEKGDVYLVFELEENADVSIRVLNASVRG
jgi:hypothetical protein